MNPPEETPIARARKESIATICAVMGPDALVLEPGVAVPEKTEDRGVLLVDGVVWVDRVPHATGLLAAGNGEPEGERCEIPLVALSSEALDSLLGHVLNPPQEFPVFVVVHVTYDHYRFQENISASTRFATAMRAARALCAAHSPTNPLPLVVTENASDGFDVAEVEHVWIQCFESAEIDLSASGA